MNATVEQAPSGNKALWAVVGLLGAAVLALGGALLYTQNKSPATPVAVVTAPAGATLGSDGKPLPMVQDGPAPPVEKPVAKPVEKRPAPTPKPAPAVAQAPAPAPAVVAPAPAPVKQVCTVCGTVETVTAVERKPKGSGLGVVAGGVLGAVVGNQIGGGSGKTAATVLGAIGGGVAGNAIEKNMKKETVYQIAVRMEDGSVRTVEKAAPVAVGAKVTVDGGTMRTSDGTVVPAVVAPAPKAAPQTPTGPGYIGG
jgi:outer membrane lipoprotein SlyB